MMQILKDLDKDHCECPFGAAGKEVGYSCPGTCLDWVYDKLQANYAFAFEIYASPDNEESLTTRWKEKVASEQGSFLQANSHLAHEYFRDHFTTHPSDFVQLHAQMHRRGLDMTDEDCFAIFNPGTEEDYNRLVENWSKAYLDMATMITRRLKGTGGSGHLTNTTV